jgi:hypothetical protein
MIVHQSFPQSIIAFPRLDIKQQKIFRCKKFPFNKSCVMKYSHYTALNPTGKDNHIMIAKIRENV